MSDLEAAVIARFPEDKFPEDDNVNGDLPGTSVTLVEPRPVTIADAGEPLMGNPFWVYLATLQSDESRRAMRGCLNRIAAILASGLPEGPDPGQHVPWHKITYAHAVMVRAVLAEKGYSPSHVSKHLSALRRVMKEAWRLGLMTAERYASASDVGGVKGERMPAGRSIHGDEMRALLAACIAGESVTGIRDAAVIAVLQSTGCRRAEVACALRENYDPAMRRLKVTGKGRKERPVWIHPDAVPHLDRWLVIVGQRRGPVFRPVDRWGNIGTRHLTGRSVGLIVATRRRQAGLMPLATHDFRRTFGGEFLDSGGDLVQLQQLFGHSSATTTAGYDRRPERALRAAVDKLHLPRPEEVAP